MIMYDIARRSPKMSRLRYLVYVMLILVVVFSHDALSESLAEYDQPTLDPGIFTFEEVTDKPDDNTDSISPKDGFCLKNGYYTNKEDCSVFYLCQNNAKYVFQCGPGLGFDQDTVSCTWRSELLDCKYPVTGDCPSLKYLTDPSDKTLFYRCAGRKKVQFKCPAGLVFNAKWSICDREEKRLN